MLPEAVVHGPDILLESLQILHGICQQDDDFHCCRQRIQSPLNGPVHIGTWFSDKYHSHNTVIRIPKGRVIGKIFCGVNDYFAVKAGFSLLQHAIQYRFRSCGSYDPVIRGILGDIAVPLYIGSKSSLSIESNHRDRPLCTEAPRH